ncbi:hypothetical protein [Candidatus Methylacidithermus pantelleriae]|uniref:Uncharacterized protein n=1 Tax=Candidatus Methylacidithermus pantelleriae TaxID=2744239 RepID=A0A8J2BNV8_9BACT|nr:hypothetical protein [Candidatus Methylacidithermus pantelleriae]CAF0702583.1 hypothetical protein MPNT_50123 [Candidatus Methylacidithermus pantelleriae]
MIRKLEEKKRRSNVLDEKKQGLPILGTKLDALLADPTSPADACLSPVAPASSRTELLLGEKGHAHYADWKEGLAGGAE